MFLSGLKVRRLAKRALFVATALFATSAIGAPRAQAAGWEAEWQTGRGPLIRYDGVPVVRQSSLFVVKPGWTSLLFDGRSQRFTVTRSAAGEPSAFEAVAQNPDFSARFTAKTLDARRLQLRFEGTLQRDVPAEIELALAYFNANLIGGRPFRAQTDAGATEGTIGVWPAQVDQFANDLVPNFRSIEFDSRLGKLKMEIVSMQPKARLSFFDARREPQQWARTAPIFWLGFHVGTWKLRVNEPVVLDMLLTLDPVTTPAPAALKIPAQWSAAPQAQLDSRPLRVVPTPKTMRLAKGGFVLNAKTPVAISGPADVARVVEQLQSVLREYGAAPVKMAALETRGNSWTTLRWGAPSTPKKDAATPRPTWATNPEGYRLYCDARGVTIEASTPQGAYYGVQTLAQLLRAQRAGNTSGALCPAVEIEDWPSMRFRGAHWFPSKSGVSFHKKLIERIMARYKMNSAVIQAEAARWDSHPEIAAPNSIAKDDLRALVALCRQNFIDPIPLINMPGHAEWMFRNKQNLDLAEDPETPYAISVLNPRSAPFLRDIVNEALDVFKPRIFHLGHDEVTSRGRFPNPENPFYNGQSTTQLVTRFANDWDAWLRARDIEMMIWGDTLLAKQEGVTAAAHAPDAKEATLRRDGLAKDIVIADWQYEGEKFPSLDILRRAGFDTVASTWHDPQNVWRFSQAALKNSSRGLLQTTWAGYFPDETAFKSELRQFTAFVLAAHYAWSGDATEPQELPFDANEEFSRAYFSDSIGARAGSLLDLTTAAQSTRAAWPHPAADGWAWDAPLRAATAGVAATDFSAQRFDGISFQIPKDGPIVLGRSSLLAGAAESLEIDAGGVLASQVALLNAAVWEVPAGTVAARLTAEYSDGTTATEDLVVGRNTAAWSSDASALRATIGAKTRSQQGVPLIWRVTRWDNPHPQKPLARLRLEPVDAESGWALLGLTLLR